MRDSVRQGLGQEEDLYLYLYRSGSTAMSYGSMDRWDGVHVQGILALLKLNSCNFGLAIYERR